jgi:glutamate synthase domain-containing protein 3
VAHALNASDKDLRTVSTELKTLLVDGPVTVQGAGELHGLAAGLKAGNLTVEGDSGDYLGALNDGLLIRVSGNAGQYLADNMTHGTVIVEGNAGYGVGAYCYGGTIVVRGSAGDFAAVMNKGATIVVGGDVGDEVATYMLAGDLVIAGNAGRNLGNYLIRGNIYIGGQWESLGHNTLLAELTSDDVIKLRGTLDAYGIAADPLSFRKIVRLSEKPFYKSHEEPARRVPVHSGAAVQAQR